MELTYLLSGISGKPIIAVKAGKVIEVCTSCTHNYGKIIHAARRRIRKLCCNSA